MKKTLIDVSKKTGYSISTISRVLNGKSEKYRISQSAKEVILQSVKELNYQPDIVAQSLRNNTTYTIGLLVPHIDNPFFANIASVVIREAQRYNYTVMLIDTLEDPVQENKAIDSLLSRKIDGISKILCIQGPDISITTKERVRGYLDALREAGYQDNAMIRGNEFSIQNGYIETKLALNSTTKPTAIFALSSTILLGAVKALNEHKVRIPQDMSIISFDDLNPPITRIAQSLENIGIIAVKMLMQKILEETELHSEILLKPNIIKRDSIKVLTDRK